VITEQQKPAELQKTLEGINASGDATKLPKVGGGRLMMMGWVCVRGGCCDTVVQTIVFVSRKDLCDSVAAGLWDKG